MIPFEGALQVRDVDQIKAHLKLSGDKFQGGCIKLSLHKWEELTSDMEVISTVLGMPINIASNLPITNKYQYPFNDKEDAFIESEIQNLVKKGFIRNSSHETGEFISPIFLREKSDGGYRLILSLKKLNQSVEYKNKFETLVTIIQLIRQNMYMTKLDIKDVYYSIPIDEPHQKFLKFEHKFRLFKFTVLPNRYTEGPKKFTKLLKPPLSLLRKLERVLAASYFDDLITIDCSYSACSNNVMKIIKLLSSFGLIVHPSKTALFSCQEIEYLGFIINSTSMKLTLTLIKKKKIVSLCDEILSSSHVKIGKFSQLVGKFSSSFIAAPQGKLCYSSILVGKQYYGFLCSNS